MLCYVGWIEFDVEGLFVIGELVKKLVDYGCVFDVEILLLCLIDYSCCLYVLSDIVWVKVKVGDIVGVM